FQKGKAAAEALAELIPGVISKLKSEKNMRWLATGQVGDVGNTSFNRPIRWIVALFGSEIVSFQYAHVASGRISRGGRWASSPGIKIANTGEYRQTLHAHQITVDHIERKELIKKLALDAAKKSGGSVTIDQALLDEVAFLVEFPTAFLGTFDE